MRANGSTRPESAEDFSSFGAAASAGLLLDRRQGQWVYYRLNPDLPTWVTAVLKEVVDANQQWLETEAKRLCGMNDRPINQAVCS